MARGGPQRGIGGGPVHHAGLNQRERLAGPSVPSFATPNSRFDLTPRFSQRAERRRRTRRLRRTRPATHRAAVLLIETDSISMIGPTTGQSSFSFVSCNGGTPRKPTRNLCCGLSSDGIRLRLPLIGTKDFQTTRQDFLVAWRRVNRPARVTLAEIERLIGEIGEGGTIAEKVLLVLRAASQAHGGAKFILGYRRIAKLAGNLRLETTWETARQLRAHG